MTNEVLATTACDACGSDANIKRRKTGKKNLYLHCSNCGLDQRNGATIQAKWQAIIDGKDGEPVEPNKTEPAQATPAPEPELPDETGSEWQPSIETQKNDDEPNEQKRGNTGLVVGTLLTLGTFAGILFKSGVFKHG